MKTKIKETILGALLNGDRLTAFEANKIGNTTAGARRIRQLRYGSKRILQKEMSSL